MLVALLACGVSYCVWQRTAEGFIGNEALDFSFARTIERVGEAMARAGEAMVRFGNTIVVRLVADASQLIQALREAGEAARRTERAHRG